MEFVDGVLIILLIVVSAGLWVVLMNMKKTSETANQITQARLDLLTKQIPDQDSFASLGKRLQSIDTASRHSFERLSKDLGGLSKATEQMMEVGKTISSLEDLLKPPKLRGGMGETLLEELLSQILPGSFKIQHKFKDGSIVDAALMIGGNIVPVDAKFPLESFRRMIKLGDSEEAKRERKIFIRAVKKHIDDIANKYILPDEGTFNFALMYIPAENVYYETIIKDEEGNGLFPYASERRVIPVSPNSFFAYLQVIVHGLKGMQIEKKAYEIMQYLNRLKGDEDRFRKEFNTLGGHLKNAQNKYDEADKRLNRFEDKLLSVGEDDGDDLPKLIN